MPLAPECFGESWIDDIIGTVTVVTALIVVSIVGVIAHKFISRKKDLHIHLKLLYYGATISSCVCLVGETGQNALCILSGNNLKWMMCYMAFVGYITLLQCVLGVFLVRLNLTFANSQLQLSAPKKYLMGFTFVASQVLWAANFSLAFHFVFVQSRYVHGFYPLLTVCVSPGNGRFMQSG